MSDLHNISKGYNAISKDLGISVKQGIAKNLPGHGSKRRINERSC